MFFSIIVMKISALRAIGRGILDGEFWKVWVEFKASLALWRYFPRILRYRISQGRTCQFHDLILNTPAFFPGVIFPKDGWYPPVEIDERDYTPMSKTASYHHLGGTLKVRIANPSIINTAAQICVKSTNEVLATLEDKNSEVEFSTGPGILIFEASEIIPAEDSGLLYDVGGWVSITPGTSGETT